MRVTANTFPNSLVDQLSLLNRRLYRLQHQTASGQRLVRPEDDPTAMQRVLHLQTEAQAVAQFRKNAATLKEQAQAAAQLIRDLKTISDRVAEISIQADGTKSADTLRLYAAQITELLKQAVETANRSFRGQHLLSGTLTDRPPFVLATDANGRVTSVTYQGNETVAAVEVAEGVQLSPQAVGANLSGTGPLGLITDPRSGADFFNHLISLQDHLLAGDVAAVAAVDRPQLARDEENLALHASANAVLQGRLEANQSAARQRAESLEALVSHEADADLAETLVRLNQTQAAYQAALQSGARLLQSSLLDYLR